MVSFKNFFCLDILRFGMQSLYPHFVPASNYLCNMSSSIYIHSCIYTHIYFLGQCSKLNNKPYPLARLYHSGSNLHFNLSYCPFLMWCLLLYIWVKLQGHPSRFLRLRGEGYSFALTLSGELPGQQRRGRSAESLRKIPLGLRTARYFGKR